MERIDTSHSIWLFDRERMLYRRLPRGADPDAPSFKVEWEQYFGLEIGSDGSFTVALNVERTHLLRSYRDDADGGPSDVTHQVASAASAASDELDESTAELRLEAADGRAD
ncbi:MAG TPA: hypothetical protein VFF40_06665 [Acidimicrobiia bacterium]|nr:hypothetical protein [Acidimicrobiia bacterium]